MQLGDCIWYIAESLQVQMPVSSSIKHGQEGTAGFLYCSVVTVQFIVAHTILSTVRKNILDCCCVGQTVSHTAVHICFSGVAAINWARSRLPCPTVACRNSSVTLLSCLQPQTVRRHAGIVRLTQCNIPQSGATPPKNQRETETTRRKALL